MDLKTNGLPVMLQKSRSSFSLFHQNIRGLSDKCEELYCSQITSKINPNIICITEHYTIVQNLSTTYLENYTLAANYSHSSSKGGGSCIYVRNDLVFNIINVTQYGIEKISEPCAIKIDCGENYIIVIHLYCSLSEDFYQFLHILDSMLMYLCKPRTQLMLCGDINENFLVDTNYKMALTILLQSYNMTNVTEFPTRINEGHGTAIDGIYIDVSRANHFAVTSISNGLSNHDAQYIVLERGFSYQTALPYHKIQVLNKEPIKYFIETIKKETWGKIYMVDHTNDILMYF
jgi:exonuclease III